MMYLTKYRTCKLQFLSSAVTAAVDYTMFNFCWN